jgi:hypothetical protein
MEERYSFILIIIVAFLVLAFGLPLAIKSLHIAGFLK